MVTKKNRLWAALALLVAVTGFTACLKDDGDNVPQRPQAGYVFLNTSTFAPGVDIIVSGQKITQNPFKFGSFDDFATYGGYYEWTFKKGGADSTLATVTGQFDSLNIYTMLIYGESPIMARAVRSDFTNADANKVNIRFFHLSPNTGAVDVFYGDKKIDSARTYDGNSGYFRTTFSPVDPAGYAQLTVKKAGTDEVIASNNDPNFTMVQGGAYTIYLMGLTGETGDKKLAVDNLLSAF